jgi:hypothetical protein
MWMNVGLPDGFSAASIDGLASGTPDCTQEAMLILLLSRENCQMKMKKARRLVADNLSAIYKEGCDKGR